MKHCKIIIHKLNNQGSALVSVLVVTAFISIIATTMLYVAAQNYQQKQTDYQNNQSFYGAEEALDELKAVLVQDVEQAYIEAYEKTTQNYLKLGNSNDRKKYYEDSYMDALKKIWDARYSSAGSNYVTMVQTVMTDGHVSGDVAKRIYKVDSYNVAEVTTTTGTEKQFVIKGVRAKYTTGNYTTFIYTDICLAPPNYDFSVSSSGTGIGAADRETIALTDYVIYMNWRKADYDE